MLPLALLAALLPFLAHAVNVVLSNDDGWAEINSPCFSHRALQVLTVEQVRTFYSALTDAGDSVVLSAPAENKSGTGEETARIAMMQGRSLTTSGI